MADFTIERSRIVDAPIDAVWVVVSNAGAYHKIVDTLEHTEITSGAGAGMIRRCLDTKGREWNEVCTLWEDGHRFRMRVTIDTYPTSFRAIFKRVDGTWTVEPEGEGTKLTIRFDGETKLGPLGRAAVAAMGRDSVLNGIFDGYQQLIRSHTDGTVGPAESPPAKRAS